MPKRCQKCNKQFDNEVDFCPYCGAPTVEVKENPKRPICSNCGIQLDGDEDFCPNCGLPIAEVKEKSECSYCGMQLEGDEEYCPVCGMNIITSHVHSDAIEVPSDSKKQAVRFSQEQVSASLSTQMSGQTLVHKIQPSNNDVPQKKMNVKQNPSTWSFSYEGRVGRQPFFICSVVWFILSIVFTIIARGAPKQLNIIFGIFLIYIPLYLYFMGFTVRRCHDFNKSAWYAVLSIIPILNFFLSIAFLFIPGTHGDNKYGPEPK